MRSWPLVALAGCADLSGSERDQLLSDHVTMLADIEARLDTIETLIPAEPAGHGKGDGDYAYEGVLAAAGAWTEGTVDVSGTGQSSNNGGILTSDLRLVYDGVVREGTTYEGPLSAQISIAIVDGDVSVSYAVAGTLACEGDVTGDADLDWTYSASSTDGGRPHYLGTIDGKPVE